MSVVQYSVVVPCGRPGRLPALLQALAAQTVPSAGLEVVIVTPAQPAPPPPSAGIRIAWVETGSLFPPGRMRNLGAGRAQGGTILFLDDDCLPPPRWIEIMRRALEADPRVAAVGCRVASLARDFWSRCADYVLFSATAQVISGLRHVGCGALAVRRDVFLQAGGFDESLQASEDWDFCLRLEAIGRLSYFCADVTVQHDHGRGHLKGILVQSYRSGQQSGVTVQRRHRAALGPAARLAAWLARPWAYPLFGLPYAMALTLLQAWEMRGADRCGLLFMPVLAAGRLAYQMGVWSRIRSDQRGKGAVRT